MQRRFAKRWCGMRVVSASIAALTVLLVAGSCGENEPVRPCPVYMVGAFEGRVLAGGTGVVAKVGARANDGLHRGHILFAAWSDSTGHYRLPVPPGNYCVEVNQDDGIGVGRFPGWGPNYVMANGIRHVDLSCARVRLLARVPASMEGREVEAGLSARDSYTAKATVHDGQLEFTFPVVADTSGEFFIGSWLSRYFWPGTYDDHSARVTQFRVDTPATVEFDLTRWAAIAGTFLGPSAGSAGVDAYTASDSALAGKARIGDDGSFLLDVFPGGAVKVRVEQSGAEQWIGGDSFAEARVFDLQPGEAVTGLTLEAGGVRCILQGPGDQVNQRAVIVMRDEAGRYQRSGFGSSSPVSLFNLRPGRYLLYVSGIEAEQTWASQWYDGAAGASSPEGAVPIDIRAGEVVPVTIQLSPGGAVEGRVLTADGTPVGSGMVTITDQYGASAAVYWIQWRDLGAFRFQGVGDGGYRVCARIDGGASWFPGTTDPDSAAIVEVADHATVTGIEWRLP